MPFLRRPRRSWLVATASRPTTFRRTMSRTSPKVFFRSSICICLIALLMTVTLLPLAGWRLDRQRGQRVRGRLHRDGDARPHGRAERDGLDVVPLDAGRLGGTDGAD